MKKVLILLLAFLPASLVVNASNYRINENEIEQLFAQSEEITLTQFNLQNLSGMGLLNVAPPDGATTKGGYLVRAFFCGQFGLHRSYMGTGNKTLWYYYFCIPVYGGIVACGDFWWVVFKGDAALSKYKGNSKFNVWAGK